MCQYIKNNQRLALQGFQFLEFEEVDLVESEASEQVEPNGVFEIEEIEKENSVLDGHAKPEINDKVKERLPLRQIEGGVSGLSNFGSNVFQYRQFSPQQLEELLKKTITGQNIIKRGSIGPLSIDSQRELVHIIVEYHCSVGLQAKEDILRWYSECIVALFKHEKTVSTIINQYSGERLRPLTLATGFFFSKKKYFSNVFKSCSEL